MVWFKDTVAYIPVGVRQGCGLTQFINLLLEAMMVCTMSMSCVLKFARH